MDADKIDASPSLKAPPALELEGIPQMTRAFQMATWLALLVAVVATYSQALYLATREKGDDPSPKYFALDNKFIILEDPRLRVDFGAVDAKGKSVWGEQFKNNFKQIWQEDYWWPKAVSGLYRPLTNFSYLLNFSLFPNKYSATNPEYAPGKQSAAPYVLVNMFLHFINTVLVFYLVALLTQRAWPGVLSAMVWAVHPVCVETVANIVGRADELSCFFALTAFLAYFKAGRAENATQRLCWLTLSGVIFLIGLTAKENTVVVVFIVLLFDFIFRPKMRCVLTKADWIFTGAWSVIFMFLLCYIIQQWDSNRPATQALALSSKPVRDAAAWANAFQYAARIGLGVMGLAIFAGIGAGGFWLLDRVLPIRESDARLNPNGDMLKAIQLWALRVFVFLPLLVPVLNLIYIWPLLERWRKKDHSTDAQPTWKWFVEKIPAYLVIAVPVLFWFSIRARLFAGMREPELPFVDNPLVRFWEEGLGGRSIVSFLTNSLSALQGHPVMITQTLANGTTTEVPWSLGLAFSEMIPAWLSAIKVVVRNIALIIAPIKMSPDYSYNEIPLVSFNPNDWKLALFHQNVTSREILYGDGMRLLTPVSMFWANTEAIVAVFIILALFIISIIAYYRYKPSCFFLVLVFLAMLPTTNLLFVMGSIQAERFLYMPTMGISVLLVLTVYGLFRKMFSKQADPQFMRILTRVFLIAICLGFAVRAWFRSDAWESDVALWEKAVKVCPNSFKTHKSLAYAWYEKSASSPDKLLRPVTRWDETKPETDWIIDHARQAIWVTRESQIVFVHLGAYLRIKGDTIHSENVRFAGLPPEIRPRSVPDPRPFYQESADTLEAAKPLDKAFNARHHRYEMSRGKKEDEIADIGNYEIYWNLGIALMRLATLDQMQLDAIKATPGTEADQERLRGRIADQLFRARESFIWMRHLAPGNPDAHLNIALNYWQSGDMKNAAISFFCTMLTDQNRQQALEKLIELYGQVPKSDNPANDPLTPMGTGVQINLKSPIVREHMLEAYKLIYNEFLAVRAREGAEQLRANAMSQHGFLITAFPPLPPLPNPGKPPSVPLNALLYAGAFILMFGALGVGSWFTDRIYGKSQTV